MGSGHTRSVEDGAGDSVRITAKNGRVEVLVSSGDKDPCRGISLSPLQALAVSRAMSRKVGELIYRDEIDPPKKSRLSSGQSRCEDDERPDRHCPVCGVHAVTQSGLPGIELECDACGAVKNIGGIWNI